MVAISGSFDFSRFNTNRSTNEAEEQYLDDAEAYAAREAGFHWVKSGMTKKDCENLARNSSLWNYVEVIDSSKNKNKKDDIFKALGEIEYLKNIQVPVPLGSLKAKP